MAKARMIHKKIWDSDQFHKLSIIGRLLYIGLITIADDYGCFRANGKFLRRTLFYSDRISARKIDLLIDELGKLGLIQLYTYENGSMGVHPKWHVYQKLRKDIGKVSDFQGYDGSVTLPPGLRLDNGSQEKRSEDNLNQDNKDKIAASFPDFDEMKKKKSSNYDKEM